MFAIYNLTAIRGNQQYVGLSALYFQSVVKNKTTKIPINEIAKVVLEKRRKLVPLVSGGIITSLGLLSILLFSSQMEVVALVALGLILTYYGLQEYLVIHLEYGSHTRLIWLSPTVVLSTIRPLIALLEFFIEKREFPILYAFPQNPNTTRIIHDENAPVLSNDRILFSFVNIQSINNQAVAVKPLLLDNPIIIMGEERVIASTEYLINRKAVLDLNTISFS